MKFPTPLVLASAAWIGATGFTAVFGFGAGASTTWLICGSLCALFGLTFCYLAWEIRRAVPMPEMVREPRHASPRVARAPRGVPIFDRIQPTTRLAISARATADEIRRSRRRGTLANS